MNEIFLMEYGMTCLEFRLRDMKNHQPEEEWNTDNCYTFPSSVKKIVFFWNETCHWTVLTTEVGCDVWTRTLYNSLYGGKAKEMGPTWNAVKVRGQIDELIRAALSSKYPQLSQVRLSRWVLFDFEEP